MNALARRTPAALAARIARISTLLLPGLLVAAPARSQMPEPRYRSQEVSYRNPEDSTYLTATLTLPEGAGPHPGVVLLSIAGTNALVDRLSGSGYAVLIPGRRGFVSVEPLLRATYADLASDVSAAVEYLRARPEVDDAAIAMIAQADDAPPAMMYSAASEEMMPLVLLAPPGFPGRDVFRFEQRSSGEAAGYSLEELQRLDRYVDEVASIVLGESTPAARATRLQAHLLRADIRLPYNAAFPTDEGQVHFFSSPLWHDRLAFEPQPVLARLRAPVLVLIGTEDPNTPMAEYLAATRRGLAAANNPDAVVCRIEGRTRHTFSRDAIETIAGWLDARVRGAPAAATPRAAPRACLVDQLP